MIHDQLGQPDPERLASLVAAAVKAPLPLDILQEALVPPLSDWLGKHAEICRAYISLVRG